MIGYSLFHVSDTIDEDRDYFIYDSAYIFIDYQLYDLALTFANILEEMSPNWYKTWQLQADVQLGLENNRSALSYLERMLDVDPFCVETWNWCAEAHTNLGEYNEAIESQIKAIEAALENEKKGDLQKHREEICEMLKAEILTRYYFDQGRIEGALKGDKVVRRAIEELSKK